MPGVPGENGGGAGPVSPATTPPHSGAAALDRLELVSHALAKAAAYLGGIGIMLLVFVTVTDVGRRAIGKTSINGLIDLTEVALVFVVYFGFAQAEVDKAHIRTSFLTERFPVRLRRLVLAAIWALILAFLLWTVWLTGESAIDSFRNGEARASQSGVPVWPARAMVSLGLFGLAIQSLVNIAAALRGREDLGQEHRR